jgi:hypothetical protein
MLLPNFAQQKTEFAVCIKKKTHIIVDVAWVVSHAAILRHADAARVGHQVLEVGVLLEPAREAPVLEAHRPAAFVLCNTHAIQILIKVKIDTNQLFSNNTLINVIKLTRKKNINKGKL